MKVGVVGNNENITLPNAIDPTSIAKNLIIKKDICLLNIPMKHIMPITILSPPYNPAISEYPISDVTVNPTASRNDG